MLARTVVVALLSCFGCFDESMAARSLDGKERAAALIAGLEVPHAPGGVVGVIDLRTGEWVLRKAFGLADVGAERRNTVDTIFGVASVSKQFTAAAAAIAAHEGYFSLDDDIRKHVPEIPDYGRPITIRHLIHHTNGLRDDGWLAKLSGRPSLYSTQAQLIRLFGRQGGVNFPAGEKFRYGNTAYVLLSEIIERKTGRALHAYAKQKIFDPLGMAHTFYIGDPGGAKNYAIPYQREGAGWSDTGAFDELARRGTGGVMTTLDDYGRWVRNLLAKESKLEGGTELTRMLLEPDHLADGSLNGYGFGLELGSYRGLQSIGHDGSGGGYKAETIVFPTESLGVFAFWNNSVYPAATVLQVVDLFLDGGNGNAATAREAGIRLPQADLESLVGSYREASLGSVIVVSRNESGLIIQYKDISYPIEPLSRAKFRTPANFRMEFDRDESGRGIRLRQDAGSDWVIGTGVFERIPPLTIAPGQLAAYAGNYYSRDIDTTYRLTVEDGRLVMRNPRSEPGALGSQSHPVVLQPSVRDEFISISNRLVFQFERGDKDRLRGFSLNAQHGWVTRLEFERTGGDE